MSKERILEREWEKLTEKVYRLKSLRFYVLRSNKWGMPGHVNDSRSSQVLSKFRTGNAGLGNRTPLEGLRRSLKFCMLCRNLGMKKYLNEEHIVMECGGLAKERKRNGLVITYAGKEDKSSKFRLFLGGDQVSDEKFLQRGRKLNSLMEDYLREVQSLIPAERASQDVGKPRN